MSIYVDWLQKTPQRHRSKFPYANFSHLFADSDAELHTFAQKLGLRRSWFQPHDLLSHYDITLKKRVEALKLGAIEVTRRTLVDMIRVGREKKEKV